MGPLAVDPCDLVGSDVDVTIQDALAVDLDEALS